MPVGERDELGGGRGPVRQHKSVALGEQFGDSFGRQVLGGQVDALGESHLVDERGHVGPVLIELPDDAQLDVRDERQRPEQDVHTLVLPDLAEEQHPALRRAVGPVL
jgi:hypothetical protein